MAQIGFDITPVYGLTEVYGPAAVAAEVPMPALAPVTTARTPCTSIARSSR